MLYRTYRISVWHGVGAAGLMAMCAWAEENFVRNPGFETRTAAGKTES